MFNYSGKKPPSGVEGVKLSSELARGGKHVVTWKSKAARYDPTVFVFAMIDRHGRTWRMLMVTYVDDLDVGLECSGVMGVYFWGVLTARLGIQKGNPNSMLGLRRTRGKDSKGNYDNSVTFDMTAYIEKMYGEFKLLCGEKIPKTPMPPHTYLSVAGLAELKLTLPAAEIKRRVELFLKIIGMLLWVSRTVAPEISTAVNMLCRHSACPSEEAMKLAFGVIAYLFGVKDVGIRFQRVDNPRIEAFYDASNKGDIADGDRAQGGYILFMGGGPIDWRAFRLAHVGMSAAHNEYMVLAVCSQAVTWVRSLLEDFGLTGAIEAVDASLTQDSHNDRPVPIEDGDDFGNIGWSSAPTPVLGDNNAAITLGREDLTTVKNRFYSRQCHYAKVAYEAGRTNPLYVKTAWNLADMFTKNVDLQTFLRHFAMIRGILDKMVIDENLTQGGRPDDGDAAAEKGSG